MQHRSSDGQTSSTVLSTFNSSANKKMDSGGARLVTFSTHSCRTPSLSISKGVQHRYVPKPIIEADWIFESCTSAFQVICLLLQYLLIYKSEKWSGPYFSATESFVHWRYIDFYSAIILLVFCISLKHELVYLRLGINLVGLYYSVWARSWKYFFVFTYPMICQALVKLSYSHPDRISSYVSSTELPEHVCSESACDLREETDGLRLAFNKRLRCILLSSFLSFYYICAAPLTFCDTRYIHLDISVLLPYGVTVFLSYLMLFTARYLPLEILTVFHRNSEHLGHWESLPNNNSTIIPTWDEKNQHPYEPNFYVKHKRQVYRSSTWCSSVAEPGNVFHARFAFLFSRPFVFPSIICVIQIILLVIQIMHLVTDQRWFVTLSQMIIFLFNTYSLHRIVRDMYLLYLVYYRE